MLGVGVMINQLGGNRDTVEAFMGAAGKTISALKLEDNVLQFSFEDGSKLRMFDAGQCCCETRYMSTDDTLSDYIGGTLDGAEIREADSLPGEYGDLHEIEFLFVKTSKGQFSVSSHNEHNGYYGGFSIVARYEAGA